MQGLGKAVVAFVPLSYGKGGHFYQFTERADVVVMRSFAACRLRMLRDATTCYMLHTACYMTSL
jgi:hypothetical protein